MKRRQHTGYVAYSMNQHLIDKVGKHIKRKQKVLANTHRYCFDKLSHMIEETNQQVTYTVSKGNSIPDVQDPQSCKPDNMSSVPEPSVVSKSRKLSEVNSIRSKEKKERRMSFMTRQRRSVTCSDLSFVYNEIRKNEQKQSNKNSYSTIIPLEEDSEEEEDKYVQILRLAKELQAEEEAKERQRLIELNRRRVRIDLSNERVMFDFECKVSKLEAPRTREMPEMLQIAGWPNLDEKVKNLSPYNTDRGREASTIKNVVNITEKQSQKQRERIKYARTKYRKGEEEEVTSQTTLNVVVNPQSHKQTEKAFRPEGEGIKIKIEDREILFKKEPKIKETTIKRRLSKAEFAQFKRYEERRKQSMLIKFKNEERAKTEAKIVPEPVEQLEPPSPGEAPQQQHQLRYPKSRSDNGGERIVVTNRIMMSDLLREYKDKQYLRSVQKPTSTNDTSMEMSTVDRYNLLYVKYGGRPPSNIIDVSKELRLESKLGTERQRGGTQRGKKYSWVGENRAKLNSFRNNEGKQRFKTQI